jgi:Domain of unknown function (DUF4145)
MRRGEPAVVTMMFSLREGDQSVTTADFVHPLTPRDGRRFEVKAIFCPNPDCKNFTLDLYLREWDPGSHALGTRIRKWSLIPESAAKPFPDYIPAPILSDYGEACLIVSLSPKASATLSRRCLQGMIRDFWGISKRRLKDEVDALEDKVAPETWEAIDSVRTIGNIGAHMEADISLIVDVDPDEATLLIDLIETLLADWYIARHNREEQMAKIKAIAKEKEKQQKTNDAAAPPGA